MKADKGAEATGAMRQAKPHGPIPGRESVMPGRRLSGLEEGYLSPGGIAEEGSGQDKAKNTSSPPGRAPGRFQARERPALASWADVRTGAGASYIRRHKRAWSRQANVHGKSREERRYFVVSVFTRVFTSVFTIL